MDSIVRALIVYGVLLVIFRVSGKRSLAQITTFDAVLLLIIAEAVQQALIDDDPSMTNAFLIVLMLVGADVVLSVLTTRSKRLDKLVNDVPLLLVSDGAVLHERMRRTRVTEDEVLEQARSQWGIERMEDVRFAVLERSGGISIIPYRVPWSTAGES